MGKFAVLLKCDKLAFSVQGPLQTEERDLYVAPPLELEFRDEPFKHVKTKLRIKMKTNKNR